MVEWKLGLGKILLHDWNLWTSKVEACFILDDAYIDENADSQRYSSLECSSLIKETREIYNMISVME